MNFFHYGNKAALIIGVILMIADSAIPGAREFGAWPVGCMFCVWYSASAIREDGRVNKKLKRWLYGYLAVVFVLAIVLHNAVDSAAPHTGRAISASFKALGLGGK